MEWRNKINKVNDKRRHDPKVHEWVQRMMHGVDDWEKFRYIDTINDYNNVIEHCQKLYDSTPVTNRIIRRRCHSYNEACTKRIGENSNRI